MNLIETKISICITYYNQEQFVKDSLDSVLAIDFPCEFEILCGDDGSSDGTLEIIKEYAQKHPQIKYFVINRKETEKSINRASLNRLNLLKNATGDYILFLDGDDYYCDKDFIKDALEKFKNNSKLSACAFNFKFLYQNDKEETFEQSLKEGNVKTKDYIKKGHYTHSGAIIFKNNITQKRFKLLEKINNFDDNAITIYMLQFGDLYYIDKPIYIYRQIENSLWNSAEHTEQDILNALDYKLILRTLHVYKKELLKRNFSPILNLYKNKKNIQKNLGEKFEKYKKLAKSNKDYLILNLINWNNISLIKKIVTKIQFKILKFYFKFS